MVNAVVELRFIIQGEADQPGFVEVLGQYALVGVLIVSLKVHSGTVLKNHVLAQHSSDAAWGEFVRQIEYKATWYGSTVVKVHRFFPSSKPAARLGQ